MRINNLRPHHPSLPGALSLRSKMAVVGAGADMLVFGRFEIAVISDSRPYFAPGLDCQMSSKSLKWRLLKRRRQSETREAKKKERRIGSMISPAEFIHFQLGADRPLALSILRHCLGNAKRPWLRIAWYVVSRFSSEDAANNSITLPLTNYRKVSTAKSAGAQAFNWKPVSAAVHCYAIGMGLRLAFGGMARSSSRMPLR